MYQSLYLTERLIREETDRGFGPERRGEVEVEKNKGRYVPTWVLTPYNINNIILYIVYIIYIDIAYAVI